MNTLTSEEMIKLQNEAKKRVLEMKEKSKFAVDDMNYNSRTNFNGTDDDKKSSAKQIKMPVELPREYNNIQGKSIDEKRKKEQQGSGKFSAVNLNLFGNLSEEELEKLLILSLCILLKNENADESLILSLLYIIS